jgi:hypothetical protein
MTSSACPTVICARRDSGECVFGGEAASVEVDHFLELALVEGVVDVEELTFGGKGIHCAGELVASGRGVLGLEIRRV